MLLFHRLLVICSAILFGKQCGALVCKSFPISKIEQIFRVGDHLLLKTATTLRQGAIFYTLNWRNGLLNRTSITEKQLFGFNNVDDHPDGRLLFASTFNLCHLWPSSNAKMKRHARGLLKDDSEVASDIRQDDDEGSLRLNSKPSAVAKLEAKLSNIEEEIKEYRERAAIREEHSQIKQQLVSLSRDLKLLVGSFSAKAPAILTSTVTKKIEETSVEQTVETVLTSTLSTASTLNAEMELHEQMRLLFFNLSQIAVEVKSKLDELKAVTTRPGTTSTVRPSSIHHNMDFIPNISPSAEDTTTAPPEANCPSVVLATFTHSQQSWQSLVCSNSQYRNEWLKSALFKVKPSKQPSLPHLEPLWLDRQLLYQRNAVQVGNRSVVARPEMSCDKAGLPANSRSYISAFSIEDRLFVQSKPGVLWDYGKQNQPRTVSIKEFLNCYRNSSVITKPLKLVGALPRRQSKKMMRSGKLKPRLAANSEDDVFGKNGDNSKHEERRLSTQNTRKKKTRVKLLKLAVTDTATTTQASSTSRHGVNDALVSPVAAVMTPHKNPQPNQSVYDQSEYELAPHIASVREIGSNATLLAQNRNMQVAGGTQQYAKWSRQNYVLIGLAVIGIAGLAICGFMFIARARGPAQGDENDEAAPAKENTKRKNRKNKKNKKHKKEDSAEKESAEEGRKSAEQSAIERIQTLGRKKKIKSDDKKRCTRESNAVKKVRQVENLKLAQPDGESTGDGNHTTTQVKVQPIVPAENAHDLAAAGRVDSKMMANEEEEEIDLHEVVVIDPENVFQLCGEDTQMANRLEMMFGESKVIAHLIDMKRKPNEKSIIDSNESGQVPSSVVKVVLKDSHGQNDLGKQCAPVESSARRVNEKIKKQFYNVKHDSPMQSPFTSPCSKSSKQKSIVKSTEHLKLIQMMHRMRKDLKKKKTSKRHIRKSH